MDGIFETRLPTGTGMTRGRDYSEEDTGNGDSITLSIGNTVIMALTCHHNERINTNGNRNKSNEDE